MNWWWFLDAIQLIQLFPFSDIWNCPMQVFAENGCGPKVISFFKKI